MANKLLITVIFINKQVEAGSNYLFFIVMITIVTKTMAVIITIIITLNTQ